LVLFYAASLKGFAVAVSELPGLPPKQNDDKQNCVDHQKREGMEPVIAS
jgi:hypothetical protein